jgi:hypothetical protein
VGQKNALHFAERRHGHAIQNWNLLDMVALTCSNSRKEGGKSNEMHANYSGSSPCVVAGFIWKNKGELGEIIHLKGGE